MTDINELTAKLKAAALAALPANERLSVLPPDDIFDISLVEGEQLDRDITLMNSFNEIANPANVLALTEALEAAERQRDSWRTLAKQNIAEREKDIAALDESRQRIADLESKLAQSESWSVSAQKYIAELEARTLTVKLTEPTAHVVWGYAGSPPDDFYECVSISRKPGEKSVDGTDRMPVWADWEIKEACAAAGIKLQIEGE